MLKVLMCSVVRADLPSFANDVAVDGQGNAYVTDTASARIWKVTPDGSQSFLLTDSPLLQAPSLSAALPTLNGIVYHPDGYLLVGHSSGGALYKVSLDGASIRSVKLTGSIAMVDGMALLSSEKLVLTSCFGTKLVATTDAWETAEITHKYFGPLHRLGTTVFVKEGKPFTSFGFGFGVRDVGHTIREAVFQPV
jgi:sugar lactone lactonase YvrE